MSHASRPPPRVRHPLRTLLPPRAWRASIELTARGADTDLPARPQVLVDLLAQVKDPWLRGYTFDAADASFELLLRRTVEPGSAVPNNFGEGLLPGAAGLLELIVGWTGVLGSAAAVSEHSAQADVWPTASLAVAAKVVAGGPGAVALVPRRAT